MLPANLQSFQERHHETHQFGARRRRGLCAAPASASAAGSDGHYVIARVISASHHARNMDASRPLRCG